MAKQYFDYTDSFIQVHTINNYINIHFVSLNKSLL